VRGSCCKVLEVFGSRHSGDWGGPSRWILGVLGVKFSRISPVAAVGDTFLVVKVSTNEVFTPVLEVLVVFVRLDQVGERKSSLLGEKES
jgi:hypothetical protein